MNPANDNARILAQAQPLAVSSANCVALTGMSWSWVTRFARAQGVPIWRVGARKQLIPAGPLAEALARVAAATELPTFEDRVAAYNAKIVADLG